MPRTQGASTNRSLQKTISRPKRVREDTVAPHAPVPYPGPMPWEPHLLQIRRRPTTSSRPTSNTLVQLALLPSQPLSSALSQGWQPNLDEAEATRQLQRWRSYSDRTASSQMGRILLYRLIVYTLHHHVWTTRTRTALQMWRSGLVAAISEHISAAGGLL